MNVALNRRTLLKAGGKITVFTGKAELGQGIRTALIQVAAEELDLDKKSRRRIRAAVP